VVLLRAAVRWTSVSSNPRSANLPQAVTSRQPNKRNRRVSPQTAGNARLQTGPSDSAALLCRTASFSHAGLGDGLASVRFSVALTGHRQKDQRQMRWSSMLSHVLLRTANSRAGVLIG
jgi:hypothetical protein